jgi:DNA-binding response OmpR family regulator
MSSIVIIERDDLMCSLIKQWLAAAGYSEREAASAGTANHADLVIVSLSVPRRACPRRAPSHRQAVHAR